MNHMYAIHLSILARWPVAAPFVSVGAEQSQSLDPLLIAKGAFAIQPRSDHLDCSQKAVP